MEANHRIAAGMLAVVLCLFHQCAVAQGYPAKPIRAVVPFAPGSAIDLLGRAVGARMAESLGQPVVIENRLGASGMIAADLVAKAAPDGYTFLFGTNSTNAALKSLMKKLPYEQDTAFAPVGFMSFVPLIVAVGNGFPARSLAELIDQARARPGKVTFATAASSQRVASEILAYMAGIKLLAVPYKSSPNALTDVVGGQVDMFTADFTLLLAQVQSGKLRPLAVTSARRSGLLPNVPAVAELQSMREYELGAWFAVYAPAGTPREVVVRLNDALNAALRSKEVTDRFVAGGHEFIPGTTEALAQRTGAEALKWAKVVREAGIEPE